MKIGKSNKKLPHSGCAVQYLPILVPSGVVDEVAVLGYVLPIGRACDRQMNFAPDDLTPKPIESPSGGLPPLRNTKYICRRTGKTNGNGKRKKTKIS